MSEIRFRQGDLVKLQFGLYPVQGVVKEDRGPIGIKGRHLYLIEFPFGLKSEPPSLVELAAVDLQLVQERVAKE